MKSFRCLSCCSILFLIFYEVRHISACLSTPDLRELNHVAKPPPNTPANLQDESGDDIMFICESNNPYKWVQRPLDFKSTTDNLTEITYDNTTHIDHGCSEDNFTFRARLKSDNITPFPKNTFLTSNDNGSILCCLHIENDKPECKLKQGDIRRRYLLIYEEREPDESKGIAMLYYVITATAVVIVISILSWFIVKKCGRATTKLPKRGTQSEDEKLDSDSHLYANQTLYANLETSPATQGNDSEESPYAQIAYPSTVLYAQLDLRGGKRVLTSEETPYAQIKI